MGPSERLDTIHDLGRLADLVSRDNGGLYVRCARGREADARGGSSDELAGAPSSGLVVFPLAVEAWWGDRSLPLWVARRLYGDARLPRHRTARLRPWSLRGREVGHGPADEPVVADLARVARIAPTVLPGAADPVERHV